MAKSSDDSRTLLRAGDRVAVLSGSGMLPVDVAAGLEKLGHSPFILMIEGEAGAVQDFTRYENATLPLEDFASILPTLKARGITHVVFAGGIRRRPRLGRLKPSWALLSILPQVMRSLAQGDDGLLGKAVRILESRGFTVLGAHEVVPDLLAGEGCLTRAEPTGGDRRDLDAALAAARAIGALDIGQAAVAIGGRAVALEGIEGTDGLLERVKALRSHGRLAGAKRGVLVKCAKPGQELRTDLPAIGPDTIVAAHAAGLGGIGVEAGLSLILDQAETIRQADAPLGVFIVGLTGQDAVNVSRPLKLAVVAGEESGDLIAADIVRALGRNGHEVWLTGVGGRHLESLGLSPLFDAHEIALIGLAEVALGCRVSSAASGQTARAIVAAGPDCVVTVDSPDFSLRVARKVRAAAPAIPIVHYVSPSVWAWRPGRAKAMRAYVDHLLCVLPFEPEVLERLGGPPATYVGHRLTTEPGLLAAAAAQEARPPPAAGDERTLLVLPGSRRSEVAALLDAFGETVRILAARGNGMRVLLPTLPRLADQIRAGVAGWAVAPRIITDADGKWIAFGEADAALIASGTVSLELALAGVPMLSCYRLDPLMRAMQGLITVWSALLPNLVADRPIAPEYYNDHVRPEMLARALEPLMADTPLRAWQKEGLAEVTRRLRTERPPGEMAAEAVLAAIGSRQ